MSKCSIFYKFWKMRQVSFLCVLCCCYCEVASVLSDSVQPHRRQPTRLPRPWDSPSKNTEVGCHFLLECMKTKSESEVTQSCPTLRDPMDCSLPGSSVHGIFQARVLEWVAIAFSVLLCTLGHHNLSLGTLHKAEQARDAFKLHGSVQSLRSVRLCNPTNCSTPGLPVHYQLPEFTQTHVHRVGDAIQPSHPLLSPSPSAPNPSQHQSLFQ